MSKVNKSKFINKRGISQFTICSIKGQTLNEREVYTINNHTLDGVLQFGVVKKGNSFELIYNLNGLVPLADYLINPLNRESFARILQNILDVLKSMQELFFNSRCLLMDFEHAYVNPATQKLEFIYVPFRDYDGGCLLKSFLLDIIQRSTFVKEEDSNYVKEYIRILNDGINFSIFELEEYIKGLVSESGYRLEKTITCFKCGTQLSMGSNFCTVCGAKITKNVSETNSTVYNPLDMSRGNRHRDAETEKCSSPNGTVYESSKLTESKAQEEKRQGEVVSGPGTQGLSNYDETSLLGMYESVYEAETYLVREKTGEKIHITKDSFRIGKSAEKCDYAVLDNKMVSRTHADIIKDSSGYVIVDLGSTNKTYVDGCEVVKQHEIHSGSRLKLANEVFTFYVEE